ncbi:phosphoenolpyruvate carboxylase [Gammaproteobacteria bacterium]
MQKPEQLYSELLDQLSLYKKNNSPFSNPVQLLSLDIFKRLQQDQISVQQLGELVQLLCVQGLHAKTKQLQNYIGELDFAKNVAIIKKLIHQMADNLPFAKFAAQIEKAIFGVVITAHPTFSISEDLAKMLAQMILSSHELTEANHNISHQPDKQIMLDYEHKASLQVIENIQAVLHEVYTCIFAIAQRRYPKRWHKLTPSLITIASWVGYDLDGRVDITWCDTLYVRIESAVLQLNRYIEQCEQVLEDFKNEAKYRSTFKRIYTQLSTTRDTLANEMLLVAEYIKNPGNLDLLLQLKLSNDKNNRLIELSALVEQINRVCKKTKSQKILPKIFMLRAEMMNYGLGMAHVHVRINAVSCHNAIHEKIHIERLPENAAEQQYYTEALNKLFAQVTPVITNLGNIIQEQTSVKRLFMVLVYILKYIDVTPIRFLIAEVENACSVLIVLYYAKLFGVEDKIDISPLFETEHGIHRGADIIETLLNNPTYYAYIKARKKLCIQTGFSDSGRYVGQVTATLALERLRIKIARLFTKYNLDDVQLIIFDTHGESIGRGSNPKSICSRIDYILSPVNRNLFKELNVSFTHETSFQGGDGYLFFKNKELALATVTRLLQNNLQQNYKKDKTPDPFYADSAYAFSFFFAIKEFHEQLFNDPDYAVLLNIYRSNMLYATGSRAGKRQHELTTKIDYSHPSQMRAIPHNAILQQLGFLLNTVSGLGQIVQKDPEKFIAMYKKSKRFASLMSMVAAADQLSSFAVLDSYVELLNSEYWLHIAEETSAYKEKEYLLKLAALLETDRRFESLKRVIRKIKMDRVKFYSIFKNISDEIKGQIFPPKHRKHLDLLHAIRLALMQNIFLSITHLPRFASSPSNMTQQDIAEMILRLEISPVLNILRSTFPVSVTSISYKAFGETTYTADSYSKGYVIEHQKLFDPMEKTYDLIRQISTGISYFNGAIG